LRDDAHSMVKVPGSDNELNDFVGFPTDCTIGFPSKTIRST
jgi:hypothetical protein